MMAGRANLFRALTVIAAGALAACLLVALVLTAGPARAAFPGSNGKIAFQSNRDHAKFEIYAMNADGTGVTRLTKNDAFDFQPAFSPFSPDGSQIAFGSSRDGNNEIYVMDAQDTDGDGNGDNPTNLTNNEAADDESPAFSPDGSQIAFTRWQEGNAAIYVMNADGTDQTQRTTTGQDSEPVFSPDGEKIAFQSTRDNSQDIWVMNSDGTDQTNLTNDDNTVFNANPAFSPDGSQIAFTRIQEGNAAIYVMNADGTDQTQRTTTGQNNDPAFSPNGEKIAFQSFRDLNLKEEVYVMNADGTDQTNLTNDAAQDFAADWGAGPPDATPPTTTASATTSAGSYTSDTWTNKDVTVELSSTDNQGGSGVKSISYSTDGGSTYTTVNGSSTTVNVATAANTSKTQTINYYATDNADNDESAQTFIVKIDKVAPSVSSTTPQNNATNVPPPATITATFTDQHSGIDPNQSIGNSNFRVWLLKATGRTEVPPKTPNGVTLSGNTLTFTPSGSLGNGVYQATVSGVKDKAGNTMANFTFQFSVSGGGGGKKK